MKSIETAWEKFDEFEQQCLSSQKDTVVTYEGRIGGKSPVMKFVSENGQPKTLNMVSTAQDMLRILADGGTPLFTAEDVQNAEAAGLLQSADVPSALAYVDEGGLNGIVII